MKEKDLKIARELKRKLSSFVKLVEMRVFGSRARGNYGKYSDMDVFIEVEKLNKPLKAKIRKQVWEVGFNNNCMVISPLITTRHDLEKTPLRSAPIIKNIFEAGVII